MLLVFILLILSILFDFNVKSQTIRQYQRLLISRNF
jgi:hypothetical protein